MLFETLNGMLRRDMLKTARLLLVFVAVALFNGCCGPDSRPHAGQLPPPVHLNLATFDSGFGGFFTAKGMSDQAPDLLKKYNVAISVTHYGDSKNSPYGNKPPAEIARLTGLGVEKALEDGAEVVVIACNTASTQHPAVIESIKQKYPDKEQYVLSVITPTISAIKERLEKRLLTNDEATLAIFATPATVKSMTYPARLADIYQGKLENDALQEMKQNDWKDFSRQVSNYFSRSLIRLPNKKTIFIYQFAPGNWVSMIEEGAPDDVKQRIVQEDVRQFLERLSPEHALDIVGLFCTHYPVFKSIINKEVMASKYAAPSTQFVEQGDFAATYAYDAISSQYKDQGRNMTITEQELKRLMEKANPRIVISGDNVPQTKNLVRTIFPELMDVIVVKESFSSTP
jgi:glutamate racemase